jgi:uncharacterized protein (TIGR04141 family)
MTVSRPPYARALTVYLLTPEILDPLDAINGPDFEVLHVVPDAEWVLRIRNTQGKRPDWTNFFGGIEGFDLGKFGKSSSVSALLVLPSGNRFWALTFGRGRSLLREGIIEDRFGLRTALNAIDPDKIRAIDKETFDSWASQARQQAISDTEFENFGINVDRDLLYAVAGVPRDTKRLGRRLAGKDALCCSLKVYIADLPSYLQLLYELHESNLYKGDRRFTWVDNIYEIRDKIQKRSLDARLVDKFQRNDVASAWMALPEIVDWQQVDGFSYANPTPSPKFVIDDLHLKYFLGAFRSKRVNLDVLTLKKSKVVCLDHNGDGLVRWSAYRCLYAEVETEAGDFFLLTNGHWYRLNREIVTELRRWYELLEIHSMLLPPMMVKESEDDYNRRLGQQLRYRLFHGSNISLPANRGPIEFCDLAEFNESRSDLIHVKRFGKSHMMSHLFYQGMNSARLFRISPEFRKVLSASVEDDPVLASQLLREPKRREYRVVFGIASSSTSRLQLPLFSKLSLRQALGELDGLGFRTAVAHIQVPSEERELKKPPGRTQRAPRKTF